MEEKLKRLQELYYSPKSLVTTPLKLWKTYENQYGAIAFKVVKDFVMRQKTSQIHLNRSPAYHYRHIVSSEPYFNLQMDLMDVSNENPQINRGIHWMLNIIDVYSRYVWVFPLPNKTKEIVYEAMSSFLDSIPDNSVSWIVSDQGSEFSNLLIKKLMKEKNIKLVFTETGDKHPVGIIERFNRTLRERMARYKTEYNTQNYIDVLPDLVEGYNKTFHTGIKEVPADVLIGVSFPEHKVDPVLDVQEGDKVRKIINKKMFEKGSTPKWSDKVYEIKDITGNEITLNDNTSVKTRQIQVIPDEIEENPFERPKQKGDVEETLEKARKTRKKYQSPDQIETLVQGREKRVVKKPIKYSE